VLVEQIMTLFFAVPYYILSLIPVLNMPIPPNMLQSIYEIVSFAVWLFPIGALIPIVVMSISMDVMTVVMAMIRMIMRFIPGLGG
jgi:hypothetical protein